MRLHELNTKETKKEPVLSMRYLELFLLYNFDIDKYALQEAFSKTFQVPSVGEPEFSIKLFKIEPKTPQQMLMTGGKPFDVLGFSYNGEDYIWNAPEYLYNYLFYLISLESPTLYTTITEIDEKYTEEQEKIEVQDEHLVNQAMTTDDFKQQLTEFFKNKLENNDNTLD